MKTLVTVILILACAGLVIALVINQKHIDEQRQKDTAAIMDFSNQVVAANDELNDLRQVNLALTNDLNSSREQLVDLSNQMITISNSLSGQLASSDAQLKSAQDQIATLQSQNEALDQQAAELTNTIDALNAKISAAQMQLAESEKNGTFMQAELTNELAANAELQRKFNDLKVVRQQARKLHDELVVQRRLAWIREGTQPNSGTKQATLLMARSWPTNRLVSPSHYNLSVEVDSSGAVHIVSDTNSATTNLNSP
jgi:chromosome segregation ATPase